jgi:uncharacterized protein (DUF1778 family)
MPTQRKPPNRKRTESIKVMTTQPEQAELQQAADQAGMALSVFVRVAALEVARRREANHAA